MLNYDTYVDIMGTVFWVTEILIVLKYATIYSGCYSELVVIYRLGGPQHLLCTLKIILHDGGDQFKAHFKICESFQNLKDILLLKTFKILSAPQDRVGKSADNPFDHLTAVSGVWVRSLHGAHICNKPSSACGCGRWFFSGSSRFRSTY